jgi:hypothetical protein
MSRVFHFLFYSCEKASFLIEKQLESELGFFENMRLRVHLFMCEDCLLYKSQSKLINKIISLLDAKKDVGTVATFTDEEKFILAARIQHEMDRPE